MRYAARRVNSIMKEVKKSNNLKLEKRNELIKVGVIF